jgi:PPOX class probable F420-dependent enzyme
MATPGIEPDKRVQLRLENDVVIWLTTVGADRRPHSRLVWFVWDGQYFLIYSVPGQKVRDIEANPNVLLHLNSDREGNFMVRIDGVAEIDGDQPPASRHTRYLAKYQERIKGLDMTAKSFSDQYHVALRVRPTRLHA